MYMEIYICIAVLPSVFNPSVKPVITRVAEFLPTDLKMKCSVTDGAMF